MKLLIPRYGSIAIVLLLKATRFFVVNGLFPNPPLYSSCRRAIKNCVLPLSMANTPEEESQQSEIPRDPIQEVIDAMYGGKPLQTESANATRSRIKKLIDEHPVLLFMKGTKAFPQCGFSDTATKILETFENGENGIEFFTVDVLSDEAIRQGIKEFSQWPTIPQLYIQVAFVASRGSFFEAGMTTQVSIITTALCTLFSVWSGGQALCKSSTEFGGSLRARAARWSQRSGRSGRSQQHSTPQASHGGAATRQVRTRSGARGLELANPMRREAEF